MILTMKDPEAPATTTGHDAISAGKVCSATNTVETSRSSIPPSKSGSCNSLTSSCSDTTSSTVASAMTKEKKRVSFSLQQTAYFSPEQLLSKEERKMECWYSEAELTVSRDEARMAIQALHHQLQLDAAAVAQSSAILRINHFSSRPTTNSKKNYKDRTSIICVLIGGGCLFHFLNIYIFL